MQDMKKSKVFQNGRLTRNTLEKQVIGHTRRWLGLVPMQAGSEQPGRKLEELLAKRLAKEMVLHMFLHEVVQPDKRGRHETAVRESTHTTAFATEKPSNGYPLHFFLVLRDGSKQLQLSNAIKPDEEPEFDVIEILRRRKVKSGFEYKVKRGGRSAHTWVQASQLNKDHPTMVKNL